MSLNRPFSVSSLLRRSSPVAVALAAGVLLVALASPRDAAAQQLFWDPTAAAIPEGMDLSGFEDVAGMLTFGYAVGLPNDAAPLLLSALGVWDEGGDGLQDSHEVGVWGNGAGDSLTLLASAALPAGAGADTQASANGSGVWRMATLANPVTLLPGRVYLFGATYALPGQPGPKDAPLLFSDISIPEDVLLFAFNGTVGGLGSGLTAPTTFIPTNGFAVGPTAVVTPTESGPVGGTAVPEAGALGLFGGAAGPAAFVLTGVRIARRRRRTR